MTSMGSILNLQKFSIIKFKSVFFFPNVDITNNVTHNQSLSVDAKSRAAEAWRWPKEER
jgi:hypothetical protein